MNLDNSGDVRLVDIRKQYKNIDVLLSVMYSGKRYEIIVEDKIHSSEHGNQLTRYKETLGKDGSDSEISCVYFKTGFQSNYSQVKNAGYRIFDRRQMLHLFGRYVDRTRNEIFRDYYVYWDYVEKYANSYADIPLSQWSDWYQVNGFYEMMQSKIIERKSWWADFGWVNNRGGGFWGLWYGLDNDKISFHETEVTLYLQVETRWNSNHEKYDMSICLKLETVKQKEDIQKLLSDLYGRTQEYGFRKPSRVRKGTHMTIGEVGTTIETVDDAQTAIDKAADGYAQLINSYYKLS